MCDNCDKQPKTLYVVTMYRYGNHESHSYVLGVWSNRKEAEIEGFAEQVIRGRKYEPEILECGVNVNIIRTEED